VVFGLFGKKKPRLKLEPKQEIELEFVNGEEVQNYFTRVLQLDRKKIIVQIPTQNKIQIQVSAGDPLTVTYLEDDVVYSFNTRILDRKEREMDLALPSELKEEKTPIRQEDFSLEIPIPVEYRAMSTAHLQTAQTKAINAKGIDIITNMPIPPGTSLHIELEIPNSPAIKTQGRVTQSQRLPDNKKALTQIEFEDISAGDRETVFRYAIFYQQRQVRKDARGQE